MSQPDVVIFGGGVAGLWLLDELVRRGREPVLLESNRLGTGQSVSAQGIIHGGLKYSLAGTTNASAHGVRQMPALWRDCLEGRREPDLRGVRIYSPGCYLWHGRSLGSRLGYLGARLGLEVTPRKLCREERPPLLADHDGPVAVMDEPVIDTVSLLEQLAIRHRQRLFLYDPQRIEWSLVGPGMVRSLWVPHPWDRLPGAGLRLVPRAVVLTAGVGNASLRNQLGLSANAMQRRPLHMVVVRGDLPRLCGHQVDGARTRMTITSAIDSQGRTVWQLGGQVAEDGVAMDRATLIAHAASELAEILPGLALAGLEASSYRVDRAEAATAGGRRPGSARVLVSGNTLSAWPTKLALAPVLVDEIRTTLDSLGPIRPASTATGPSRAIASRRRTATATPWEASESSTELNQS